MVLTKPKQIRLGLFVRPVGHHIAAWRHPEAEIDACVNFQRFVQMAKTAERGRFDMLFSADSVTAWTAQPEQLHYTHYVAWIDPFTMLSALAPLTQHIGLVCTATTSYDEPYSLARKFASLDLVSGGRAGWNLVTSDHSTEADNFGRIAQPPKVERYQRAREFADVVKGLWNSWDDDAFVHDRETGIFFDPNKMRVLNHDGKYFRVKGPLNVARSPQGQPVLVQAGASESGMELAAETAEVVFGAQPSLAEGKAFYANVKARMMKFNRVPAELKVMPGLSVTVGKTEEEAKERFDRMQTYIHPEVGVSFLSTRIGFDLRGYPLDGPLPELPKSDVISSRREVVIAMAKRENLTIRQLYEKFAGARGHLSVVGTPKRIVDCMQEWMEAEAADGFNIILPYFPGGLEDFVDQVIPELQRRRLFRTEYESSTLRGNLGLDLPHVGK